MNPALVVAIVAVVLAGGMILLVARMLRTVEPGTALVITGASSRPKVVFTRAMVIPVLHRAETIDITTKRLVLVAEGANGVVCRDRLRADVTVCFDVRVSPTAEDIMQVAQAIGCARAGELDTLKQLFMARFQEAVRSVFIQLEFAEVAENVEEVRDQILRVIGEDLSGYRVEGLAFERLRQTPVDQLDPHNILDAEGIRRLLNGTALARRMVAGVGATHLPQRLLPARIPLRDVPPLNLNSRDPTMWRLVCTSSPSQLVLEANADRVLAFAMDEPYETSLRRRQDQLVLAIAQSRHGATQILEIEATTASVKTARGGDQATFDDAVSQLPEAEAASAFEVDGGQLVQLLAALRAS